MLDRCPYCGRRLMAVFGSNGRTELQCLWCDKPDPMTTR